MGELATTKMLRSFGSHAKSNFDRTLSCGFDMESEPLGLVLARDSFFVVRQHQPQRLAEAGV